MIWRRHALLRGETPSHWPWATIGGREQWVRDISHRQAGLGVCRCCAVLSKSKPRKRPSQPVRPSTEVGKGEEEGKEGRVAHGPGLYAHEPTRGASSSTIRLVTCGTGRHGEHLHAARRFIVHNTIGHLLAGHQRRHQSRIRDAITPSRRHSDSGTLAILIWKLLLIWRRNSYNPSLTCLKRKPISCR